MPPTAEKQRPYPPSVGLAAAVALAAVTLLAFVLRYHGISFGFPIIVHPDEPQIANPAIIILQSGSFHPSSFLYPSLYIYMTTAVFAAVTAIGNLTGSYGDISSVPITTLYYWARLLTIILSVATVAAIFALARRISGVLAGLSAALLTACSFLHVSNSFMLTTDAPMALGVVLAVLMAARIHSGRASMASYLIAGGLVGIAGGTKYNAVFVVAPLILAHLLRERSMGERLLDWRLVAALVTVPLVFVATTPFAIIDYDGFTAFLEIQRQAYSLGHPGADGAATSYGYYGEALRLKLGLAPLIAGAAGAALLLLERPRLAAVLLSFPVVFFTFMGAYTVHFDRNIVVMVPFVALFAGITVEQTLAWATRSQQRWTRRVATVAAVLVVGTLAASAYQQALKSLDHTRRITLPNTRYLAKLWIEENLPADSRIAREHFTPPIDEKRFKVTRLEYYGLLRATNLERFDYLVTSSDDFGRFVFHPERYPAEAARYRAIFKRYHRVHRFQAEDGRSYGPEIIVYATRE